jgi:hypothetical protein
MDLDLSGETEPQGGEWVAILAEIIGGVGGTSQGAVKIVRLPHNP